MAKETQSQAFPLSCLDDSWLVITVLGGDGPAAGVAEQSLPETEDGRKQSQEGGDSKSE